MRLSDRRRRSLLYLPASNPRALAKAATLPADALILDLEDAVAPADKEGARRAAVAALDAGFGREAGLRINPPGTPWHDADLAAARASAAAFVVLPKVEAPPDLDCGPPLLAMVETPAGVLAAPAIARACAGLIAGTNDLAAELRATRRSALGHALQSILLAARAAGLPAWDGVFNRLDDPAGFAAEATEGRALGFDGKTLIHPSQVEPANAAFGPTEAELEEARALVAAAAQGAARFRGRMVEALHVAAARRLLAEAGEG